MNHVAAFAAVLCGLVLAVSSAGKVRGKGVYAEFVASVPAFGVPARWARRFAAVTLAAEFVIAALLLPAAGLIVAGAVAGRWLAISGLVLAFGLFGVLTAAVWRAVARRTGAVCRCFGPARTALAYRHVVRNALLLLVAAAGVLAVPGTGGGEPVGLTLAAALGVVGAVAVVRFEDLAELFAGAVPEAR
ncbi:MauE/DoxX family redox-associated membrane protein [Amycolatopsis azurea]|uniref:MauE/DoxX family redox-associated membrane protein n=1 Tax=Amycolatopsis azurea TaxID=36819 RepID=UPI0037FCDC72